MHAGEYTGSGDVKYHLGTSYNRPTINGKMVHLSLMANPSHLEVRSRPRAARSARTSACLLFVSLAALPAARVIRAASACPSAPNTAPPARPRPRHHAGCQHARAGQGAREAVL